MAERSGTGLQNLGQRFDSASHLRIPMHSELSREECIVFIKDMKLKTVFLAFLLALSGIVVLAQDKGAYSLLVDKGAFTLSVLDSAGVAVAVYPVATGLNPGPKKRSGDHKTPEGSFSVTWIQNTKGVMYDYHDGKGKVEAYGPYFIHLRTPGFKAIGIHGTCPERDDRIGTRDSHGCIRLHNEDLLELLPYVKKGTVVKIVPGPEDL